MLSNSVVAQTSSEAPEIHPPDGWVVSAEDAAQMIRTTPVTILDTRGARAFARMHVDGAVRVDWTRFSQTSDPNRGKLLGAEALQDALRAVGVRNDRPVLVVGGPPGDWGEDGRVAWMLRFAGHKHAAIVDGGITALRRAEAPMSKTATSPVAGDFVVQWDRSLNAVRDDLLKPGAIVIDAREPREFRGATPYGESRGGHVPGAKNLYFKDLMKKDGRQLDVASVRKKMADIGAEPDSQVIVYCTGGVRSGWLVAVLRNAGYTDVRNYAGSMWDWSAAPAETYQLELP